MNVIWTATESNGAPCRTRTCGLLVRSQTLYPAELRAHAVCSGSRIGNRRKHRVYHDSAPAVKPEAARFQGMAGWAVRFDLVS